MSELPNYCSKTSILSETAPVQVIGSLFHRFAPSPGHPSPDSVLMLHMERRLLIRRETSQR
ncbi:hypothetical protein E2C01_051163 [Portunus trituberculatus]|uniref:Uncharacterized protein n=1 Tax=Portunus trituberculatus TaxID=210409 RepID=A0A5B7GJF8_PORTR|nr:hypothetical protein [Portunus trituberculatus]